MLRASIISIVLVLSAGPNVALLCCQSVPTQAGECQHQDARTLKIVATAHNCSQAPLSFIAPPREDGKTARTARSVDQTMPVSAFQATPLITATRAWHDPCHERGLEKRPLFAALRI